MLVVGHDQPWRVQGLAAAVGGDNRAGIAVIRVDLAKRQGHRIAIIRRYQDARAMKIASTTMMPKTAMIIGRRFVGTTNDA